MCKCLYIAHCVCVYTRMYLRVCVYVHVSVSPCALQPQAHAAHASQASQQPAELLQLSTAATHTSATPCSHRRPSSSWAHQTCKKGQADTPRRVTAHPHKPQAQLHASRHAHNDHGHSRTQRSSSRASHKQPLLTAASLASSSAPCVHLESHAPAPPTNNCPNITQRSLTYCTHCTTTRVQTDSTHPGIKPSSIDASRCGGQSVLHASVTI